MDCRRFLKLFLIELLFFVVLLAFLICVKSLVGSYLGQIQDYNLNTETEQDIINTQMAIDELSSVVNKAYFTEVLVVPLGIFLIFALLQGYSLIILLRIQHWKKYMLKFSIISAILIISLIIAVAFSLWLLIFLLILAYLGFILAYDIHTKKGLRLAYKQIYVLLPLFLLGLVIFSFEILILLLLLGVFSAGLYSYALFYIIPLIIVLVLNVLYKLLYSFVLKKY